MLGLKLNHVSKRGHWRRQEPEHHQPWYWPVLPGIIRHLWCNGYTVDCHNNNLQCRQWGRWLYNNCHFSVIKKRQCLMSHLWRHPYVHNRFGMSWCPLGSNIPRHSWYRCLLPEDQRWVDRCLRDNCRTWLRQWWDPSSPRPDRCYSSLQRYRHILQIIEAELLKSHYGRLIVVTEACWNDSLQRL